MDEGKKQDRRVGSLLGYYLDSPTRMQNNLPAVLLLFISPTYLHTLSDYVGPAMYVCVDYPSRTDKHKQVSKFMPNLSRCPKERPPASQVSRSKSRRTNMKLQLNLLKDPFQFLTPLSISSASIRGDRSSQRVTQRLTKGN